MRFAVAVALAAITIGFFSNVSAQTYKRHALIEEGTGNWCGYCPYGAFTIDSMVAKMKDNLVVISWHGPENYGDPLYLVGKDQAGTQAIDTIASFDGATGGILGHPSEEIRLAAHFRVPTCKAAL